MPVTLEGKSLYMARHFGRNCLIPISMVSLVSNSFRIRIEGTLLAQTCTLSPCLWYHREITLVIYISRLRSSYRDVQYEPKKFCRRAAESGRPLRAANRRLPTPSSNGGERQTPVIFTPRAVLDPMLQTMMDPGTSLPDIPLHESQVTAARLTGGNSFRSLHMYALCILYTGRIK